MTLVLDNLSPDLETRLRREAQVRGIKPEDVALEVLRERFERRIYTDADFLIGTMTEDEFQQFERSTAMFSQIDDEPSGNDD